MLGVNWDIKNDLVVFDFTNIWSLAKSLTLTKRNLWKGNAIFLSIETCFVITLQGKLLFKLLCIDKSDWVNELTWWRRIS